jgi:hypothetical protein
MSVYRYNDANSFASFDVGNRAARMTRRNPTNDPDGDPNIRHRQTTAPEE